MATEDIIPRIRQLGDITLGNSQAFQRLSLQYSQVVAKQRVLAEEVNRFTEAGVPLVELLRQVVSESKGVEISTSEFFKVMETGAVTVTDLNRAFDLLTEEGGKFADGLARGAETVAGQLAKTEGAIQNLAVPPR